LSRIELIGHGIYENYVTKAKSTVAQLTEARERGFIKQIQAKYDVVAPLVSLCALQIQVSGTLFLPIRRKPYQGLVYLGNRTLSLWIYLANWLSLFQTFSGSFQIHHAAASCSLAYRQFRQL